MKEELCNHDRFPNNIFKAEIKEIDQDKYLIYKARFSNLYDLYNYLNSNPNLNLEVFSNLDSETSPASFAGKSYKKAVEDLISDIDPGYEEFLKLQKEINNAKSGYIHKYQTVKVPAGGHLDVRAYSVGAPLCYETQERISKPKFIKLHIALSYNCNTTKSQVYNRAVIITNVVKALEKAGYRVALDVFELSYVSNEIVNISINVKKHDGQMNMSILYKTLCHVEFLRRILFRVLETMEVKKSYWGYGYGSTCSEAFARKVLRLDKNDIFFAEPSEMNIKGEYLSDDFIEAIKHINLKDKINVDKVKEEFDKNIKTLRKK